MISVNNITFSDPKSNRSGGQHIFLNKKNSSFEDSKFFVSLPKSKVPFGVTKYNSNKSISIQISDEDLEMYFYDLDNLIKQTAQQNSFKWFKKNMHESVIQELYKPQLKQNQKFPPLLNVKIPAKFDNIYNKDNKKISIDDIKSKDFVEAEIENNGVYFVNSSFGTSWKVVKLTVHNMNEQSIKGYSFIDDEDV